MKAMQAGTQTPEQSSPTFRCGGCLMHGQLSASVSSLPGILAEVTEPDSATHVYTHTHTHTHTLSSASSMSLLSLRLSVLKSPLLKLKYS